MMAGECDFSQSTYSSATWSSLDGEAAVAINTAVADNTAVAETSADDGLVLHLRGVTPVSQTEDAELNCHMRRSYVEQMADHHQEHAAPVDGAVAVWPRADILGILTKRGSVYIPMGF